MKKIDNLIAGLIGFALFAAFAIGLAETISTVPFIVIVAIVFCMAAYDFYESCIKSDADS
ncbi:MAG: hypothetical protein RIM72_11350 [Alphaproteobacteria bacterium]